MRTRPKIGETAKIADVSTATVDRVLNNRASVSRRAVTAVREALRSLTEGKSALPVVNKVFDVILPHGARQ
ncbi:MAG: LacI family transcriptional regulator [Gammaproteobacteria bacterium]|nr:LacI family transcriptional regulator [Gammaproteobacteria bacterium]